jgi:alkanesulfonate monooxygenase SsuD/methylene tetrahydromethanopterin reductase-like flavin-dependent oxidoreductase (luciferase family)
MRFGAGLYCLQSTATMPRHPATAYAEVIEDAQLLDRLGYDALWLSEHHFFYDGYCPSLPTAAASILASTERLKVATGMLLAPMRDAQRLAAETAELHRTSGGRFELGVALGYRDIEFDGKGVSRTARVERRRELLRAVRAAAPDVPVWLGSALPDAVARAGAHGHGVLFSGANPMSLVSDLARSHREGWEDSDRSRPRPRVAALRNVWVTDDAAEREAVLDWFRASYVLYAGLGWSVPKRGGTEAMDFRKELDKALDDAVGTAIIGSAEEVIEGLASVAEAGVDDVVFRVVVEGAPQAAVHEVLHRLAEEVMPALHDVEAT